MLAQIATSAYLDKECIVILILQLDVLQVEVMSKSMGVKLVHQGRHMVGRSSSIASKTPSSRRWPPLIGLRTLWITDYLVLDVAGRETAGNVALTALHLLAPQVEGRLIFYCRTDRICMKIRPKCGSRCVRLLRAADTGEKHFGGSLRLRVHTCVSHVML